jgi:hypothetical protein
VATVVIHAGMPKAGSSTIQHWLAVNARRLRREHDTVVAVARGADPVRVGKYDGRESINSHALVLAMGRSEELRGPALGEFFSGLDEVAAKHPTVVVTSEAFAHSLWRPDEDFVDGLDDLGSRHRVRVALYLRPQHTALEAAWRQWGFRSGGPPSAYLTQRARQLDYWSSFVRMRSRAARVDFVPRPFRADLLDRGDVVVDFAGRYLGVEVEAGEAPPVNPGLPLELVNLLRAAPDGTFWSSRHDNAKLRRMKHIYSDLDLPDSERIRRSRDLLQTYCHERFEPGNLELIRELGWPATEWVPAPTERVGGGLEELDELWAPSSSPAELSILFRAISRALD